MTSHTTEDNVTFDIFKNDLGYVIRAKDEDSGKYVQFFTIYPTLEAAKIEFDKIVKLA